MPTTKEEKELGWLSVTEVLGYFQEPGLVDWKVKTGAKEAKRIGTIAMKIGSRVDELVKLDMEVGKVKFSVKDGSEVKSCFEAYLKWKEDYNPKLVNAGITIRNEHLMLQGEYDLLLEPATIIDIKCSSSIKLSYWLQTAMYAYMLGGCDKIGVLRLDKNLGIYEYVVRDYDPSLVEVYLGLLNAYHFFNGRANGSLFNSQSPNGAGEVHVSQDSPTDHAIRTAEPLD